MKPLFVDFEGLRKALTELLNLDGINGIWMRTLDAITGPFAFHVGCPQAVAVDLRATESERVSAGFQKSVILSKRRLGGAPSKDL